MQLDNHTPSLIIGVNITDKDNFNVPKALAYNAAAIYPTTTFSDNNLQTRVVVNTDTTPVIIDTKDL